MVEVRLEELLVEFFDVGAVVYFLRKAIWMVPDFSVARYETRLRQLHTEVDRDGRFVAQSSRFLIEAQRPAV